MAARADAGGTVLVVEDDAMLRQFVRDALERAGYGVVAAESGEAALAIAAGSAGSIDVLLADVVLPGMNGAAVWRAVGHLHPSAVVVFMSGHDVGTLKEGDDTRGPVLEKPFTADALLRAVAGAARAPR
jgi:DNA-binding response OmpR family regulator